MRMAVRKRIQRARWEALGLGPSRQVHRDKRRHVRDKEAVHRGQGWKRTGGPRVVTAFSSVARAAAEAKRERRKQRRLLRGY